MTIEHERYGERAIAQVRIKYFRNPTAERDYLIQIRLPELTFKDPVSGYPDFAVVTLVYAPHHRIVDLKTLKLYINSLRDAYFSHERVASHLFETLTTGLKPRGAFLMVEFNPRGNVTTRILHVTDDAFLERARQVLSIPTAR